MILSILKLALLRNCKIKSILFSVKHALFYLLFFFLYVGTVMFANYMLYVVFCNC